MADKELTFEQAMERLEQIVRTMERGDVPLEESLNLFQEGTKLVNTCAGLLETAKMEIEKVAKADDGTPVFEEFHDEI